MIIQSTDSNIDSNNLMTTHELERNQLHDHQTVVNEDV